MTEISLTLTEKERTLLVGLLETALADTRVEARRTHYSPEFRAQVLQEEGTLRALLSKLQRPPA
jgi:hypothetical protein